jgi:hypothetical protein
MTINKDVASSQSVSLKDKTLAKQFQSENMELELETTPLTEKSSKDSHQMGEFYGNSIQLEDSALNPSSLQSRNFVLLPIYADLSELDDSFQSFKGLSGLFSKFSSPQIGTSSLGFAPRSYMSVFNHFRSDYEDFM